MTGISNVVSLSSSRIRLAENDTRSRRLFPVENSAPGANANSLEHNIASLTGIAASDIRD